MILSLWIYAIIHLSKPINKTSRVNPNLSYGFLMIMVYQCEEGNGNPLSTLAWIIPWTEEPGRLQSMGSQRVGHD